MRDANDEGIPTGEGASPPRSTPIEAARAAGHPTLTGRVNAGDDGVVEIVVRVKIAGTNTALLDALDSQTLTPQKRGALLSELVYRLAGELDKKHGNAELRAAIDPAALS